MEFLQNIGSVTQSFLLNNGILGIFISCAIIFIESILPCMPLGVFVTGIFYTYGNFYGLLLCWICTCLGCMASYHLCNKYIRNFIENKFIKKLRKKTQRKIYEVIEYIDGLSISSLTLLVACPFTPAFVLNIAAGLADVDKKKYLTALIVGKPFMIYFFGVIGTSLIESITDPNTIIKVLLMMFVAYGLSKICDKLVKA